MGIVSKLVNKVPFTSPKASPKPSETRSDSVSDESPDMSDVIAILIANPHFDTLPPVIFIDHALLRALPDKYADQSWQVPAKSALLV